MITLHAADDGGWALVEAEGKHWLVRPPYTLATRAELSREQVLRAVSTEDFVVESTQFEGWAELCRELARRRIEAATPEQLAQAAGAAERLLARSTPEQARASIGAIENAISQGRSVRAQRTIAAILSSSAMRADEELSGVLLELLKRCEPSGRAVLAPVAGQLLWAVKDEDAVARQSAAASQRGGIIRSAAA